MQESCVAFVGSTGVGKTTTIAKIAAHAKLSYGKKVGFITIDTYRIGAVEQLKIYADIMDIPMLTVMTPADMRPAYQKLARTCDFVLVDTLGTSYRNQDQIEDIRRYLSQIEGLRRVAVLTATLDIEVFEKTLEAYDQIGMDFTILTKLDEMDANTRLFSYVRRLTAPLSYITTGQNVPDDLQEASTTNLMSYLWEAHEQNERPGA
jgi:flagellar biosynthesis protein FlhF